MLGIFLALLIASPIAFTESTGLQADGSYLAYVRSPSDNSDLVPRGGISGSYTKWPTCEPTDKAGCSDTLKAHKGVVVWKFIDGRELRVTQ